jgi:hypothetical protein
MIPIIPPAPRLQMDIGNGSPDLQWWREANKTVDSRLAWWRDARSILQPMILWSYAQYF